MCTSCRCRTFKDPFSISLSLSPPHLSFCLLNSQMLQIYMADLLALCIPLIPTDSLTGLGVLERWSLFFFWWINPRKDRTRCPHQLHVALYSDSVVILYNFSLLGKKTRQIFLCSLFLTVQAVGCGTQHTTWLWVFSFFLQMTELKNYVTFQSF